MSKTIEDVCNETILAQLALDDPQQFGDVDAIDPDSPAGLVLGLVRKTVRNTVEAVEEHLEEDKAKQAVSVVLGQMSVKLARATASLVMSTLIEKTGSNISPLLDTISPKRAKSEYKTYMNLLEAFGTAIGFTQTPPREFPVTKQTTKEANFLAPVFGFLAERRHALRRRIHPSVCQHGIGDSISEQSADRADEIAAMYHTLVVGTVLPEAPENWTLRDKPEDLRMTVVGMLGDLLHLAHAAEMDWRELLAEARASYEDDLKD